MLQHIARAYAQLRRDSAEEAVFYRQTLSSSGTQNGSPQAVSAQRGYGDYPMDNLPASNDASYWMGAGNSMLAFKVNGGQQTRLNMGSGGYAT